jgi:hypothetical protein
MTVTYGFYNSVANDRLYDAIQLSKFLEGVIVDGVMPNIGNKLNTVQNSGMSIFVGSGKAWFNNTWTYNDSNLALTVTAAHPTLNRIDSVVLEVDTGTGIRVNRIIMVDGTAASSPVRPTLTDTSTKFYHRLADITVGAGVTQILTANISIRVNTVDCPYVISATWETTNLQNQIDTTTSNLNDVNYRSKNVEIILVSGLDTLTVGDKKGDFEFTIPPELNGYNLIDADAAVFTVSSSGLPTFQIANITDGVDMLSTKITIDANEYNSYSAATQPVIDTTKDDVATGDRLRFDCDVAGTGTKGFSILLTFGKP